MIDFFVAGTPVTQGSKTAIKVGNRAVVVEGKSKKSRDSFAAWRHAIATEARHAAGGSEDFDSDAYWPTPNPVIVTLTFGLQRPASAPKRRRTWPTGARSGDVDKLARAALDSITGVLIADDAQVVGLSVTKAYGRPGVRVRLWAEEEEQLWVPEWTLACGPELCGRPVRATDPFWCDDCKKHLAEPFWPEGQRREPWDRTWFAQHGEDCPLTLGAAAESAIADVLCADSDKRSRGRTTDQAISDGR